MNTPLPFSGLWFWMRWLCLGLTALLHGLIRLAGSPGFAIVLLAVCARIIMLPFTILAEKWQREVNVQDSKLQPLLAAISGVRSGTRRDRQVQRCSSAALGLQA